MRILLAFCLSILLSQPSLAEIEAPTGPVLLTVGGAVETGNRGPSTQEDLTVLGKMGLTFDVGVAFDGAMLAALPQAEITTKMPGSDTSAVFSGPRLSAVMEAASAAGKSAFPMALDGYQIEIPWDVIEAHEPILATHVDGIPLGIGDIGPTMTVFPVIDDRELYEDFLALQVWATFYIDVE